MNRTRALFLGGLLLALGAFVCLLVYKSTERRVAVAATDIQVDAKLGDREVRLIRIPKSVAPPDALHSTSEIIGRRVILPILKGEFILPSKLAAENTGSGPLIPVGMRAVSVRVYEVTSVDGFPVPGSRVDGLTGNSSMTNEPLTTIVKDVVVIAVGSMIEWNAAGEPQTLGAMTLLVLPEDEQKLRLASSQGHIQLAVRQRGEITPRSVDAVHLRKAIHRPNN